jgi:hypothetical protein
MKNHKNKSTGPVTPEGKAISCRNAFKHGLASSQILIQGEDNEALESLVNGFEEDFQPSGMTETALVHDLAKFHWLKNRAIRLQQGAFLDPAAIDTKFLDLMMRYQNSNQRAFMSTLRALEAFQKERLNRDREFVSQPTPVLSFGPYPELDSDGNIIPGTEPKLVRPATEIDENPAPKRNPISRPPGKLA